MTKRRKLSPFPEVPPVVTRVVAGAMAIGVVVACGGDETDQPPQATGAGGEIGPQPGPGPGGFGGAGANGGEGGVGASGGDGGSGGAGGAGGPVAPQPGPGGAGSG